MRCGEPVCCDHSRYGTRTMVRMSPSAHRAVGRQRYQKLRGEQSVPFPGQDHADNQPFSLSKIMNEKPRFCSGVFGFRSGETYRRAKDPVRATRTITLTICEANCFII